MDLHTSTSALLLWQGTHIAASIWQLWQAAHAHGHRVELTQGGGGLWLQTWEERERTFRCIRPRQWRSLSSR